MPLSVTHPYIAWQEDPMSSNTTASAAVKARLLSQLEKESPKEGICGAKQWNKEKRKEDNSGRNQWEKQVNSGRVHKALGIKQQECQSDTQRRASGKWVR